MRLVLNDFAEQKSVQVEHQEVTGVIRTEPWSRPVLVFAEDWPSLAFSAQAVGSLDITTWCKFKSGKSKVEFTSTRLGSSLASDSLDKLAARYGNQCQVTVLVQGCATFANEMQSWAEKNLIQAKTLELIPTPKVGDWDNTFLWKGAFEHHVLGGVTSGSWSYRCSEPLGDPNISMSQNLGLLLRPTHGGRAISKIESDLVTTRRPLLESNLIEPCETNPWIVAPSVFTANDEKGIHSLQINELFDVYNVEIITQKELGNCW